jgi:hypothetical protein
MQALLIAALILTPSAADIEEAMGLEYAEYSKLKLPKTAEQPFEVWLPLDGMMHEVRLQSSSVRAEGFQLYEAAAKGKLIAVKADASRTLRGFLPDRKDARVAGSLLEDGLYLTVVFDDGVQFWVEPAAAHLAGIDPHLHVVYRQDALAPQAGSCGTTDKAGEDPPPSDDDGYGSSSSGLTAADTPSLSIARLAIDSDVEYFQLQGSAAGVLDRAELLVACSNLQYEREVAITHRLSTVVARAAADPYNAATANGLLNQVMGMWPGPAVPLVEWDLVHMLTGQAPPPAVPGPGTTIGLAQVGGLCDPSSPRPAGIEYFPVNGPLAFDVDLLSHEMGHSWGARHTTCTTCPVFTMDATTGAVAANRFSSTSRQVITTSCSKAWGCLERSVANDFCEEAFPVCNGQFFFTNRQSTADGRSGCIPTLAGDVWFSYAPRVDGTLRIDTFGSSFDTVLSVHTDCPGGPGNQIACNDDFNPPGVASKLTLPVIGGTTLYIRVSGHHDWTGDIQLNLSGPDCGRPQENLCRDARTLCPGEYYLTTELATLEDSAACESAPASDVWYTYTPAVGGLLHIDTNGSSIDASIGLYTGCAAGMELASACGVAGTGTQITMNVVAGVPLFIRIAGTNGQSGPFRLGLMGPACAEDLCGSARVVGEGRFLGTLRGTGNEGGGACTTLGGVRDVFYRYTAPRSGVLVASTCGTNDLFGPDTGIDTVVSMHRFCPATPANMLACNDDWVLGGAAGCVSEDTGLRRDSVASANVFAGQLVIVRVSAFREGMGGEYVLDLGMLPDNDLCANATPLSLTTPVIQGSTRNSTLDGASSCGNPASPGDVWYRFTNTQGWGTLQVSTCNTFDDFGLDAQLSLHSGCPGGTGNELACETNATCTIAFMDGLVTDLLAPGETVFVRVSNGMAYGEIRQGAFWLHTFFSPMQIGALQNISFDDPSGDPWLFVDESSSGSYSVASGRGSVRGGNDGGPVHSTRSWIEQDVALNAGPVTVMIEWEYLCSDAPGYDEAYWDLIDRVTGQSVVGGPRTLASSAPAADFTYQQASGSGSYTIRLGVLSDDNGYGAGTLIVDHVTVTD